MRVLILGGTGTISSAITNECLESGYDVIHFNRGTHPPSAYVEFVRGNRFSLDDLSKAAETKPDVVIDMLCFDAEHAQLLTRVFKYKIQQLILCSTACVYDVKSHHSPFTESMTPNSHWHYGVNKARAESVLREASQKGAFNLTVFRPSHVYDADKPIHQLGLNGMILFQRINLGLPVLLLDQGAARWEACFTTDAGKGFAAACLNPVCYGRNYNLGNGDHFTWRTYYKAVADVLGIQANLWSLENHHIDSDRYAEDTELDFARHISRYDFVVNVNRLHSDIPQLKQHVSLESGLAKVWEANSSQKPKTDYSSSVTQLLQLSAELEN
jgi:nucleoside-diphosphate-sugar epimerase